MLEEHLQEAHQMEPAVTETIENFNPPTEVTQTTAAALVEHSNEIEETDVVDPFDAGLTLQEAAYVYGYSKKQLRKLIDEGRLPAVQVECGRKKKLKWRVFPSGVPVDFFDNLATQIRADVVTSEQFPLPPADASPSTEPVGEDAFEEQLSQSASSVELSSQAPSGAAKKEKKRKKKKLPLAAFHEEASVLEEATEATSVDDAVDELWSSEKEVKFNALLSKLASEVGHVPANFSLPPAPEVEAALANVALEVALKMTPETEVENAQKTTSSVEAFSVQLQPLAASPEARAVNVALNDVSFETRTVFDAIDESGLLTRLASLEDEVCRLQHKNTNLEAKISELEATVKGLTGDAKGRKGTNTLLFMLPFVLTLLAAASLCLR